MIRDRDEAGGDRGDGQKGKRAKVQANRVKCKTCPGFANHESGKCSKYGHAERIAQRQRPGHREQPQQEPNQQQQAENQCQPQGGSAGVAGE